MPSCFYFFKMYFFFEVLVSSQSLFNREKKLNSKWILWIQQGIQPDYSFCMV